MTKTLLIFARIAVIILLNLLAGLAAPDAQAHDSATTAPAAMFQPATSTAGFAEASGEGPLP